MERDRYGNEAHSNCVLHLEFWGYSITILEALIMFLSSVCRASLVLADIPLEIPRGWLVTVFNQQMNLKLNDAGRVPGNGVGWVRSPIRGSEPVGKSEEAREAMMRDEKFNAVLNRWRRRRRREWLASVKEQNRPQPPDSPWIQPTKTTSQRPTGPSVAPSYDRVQRAASER